jgi:hypothetical protein
MDFGAICLYGKKLNYFFLMAENEKSLLREKECNDFSAEKVLKIWGNYTLNVFSPQRKHSMTTKKATRSHSGCCQLTVFFEFQHKQYFISYLSVSP